MWLPLRDRDPVRSPFPAIVKRGLMRYQYCKRLTRNCGGEGAARVRSSEIADRGAIELSLLAAILNFKLREHAVPSRVVLAFAARAASTAYVRLERR